MLIYAVFPLSVSMWVQQSVIACIFNHALTKETAVLRRFAARSSDLPIDSGKVSR